MISESKKADIPGVKFLNSGMKGTSWSSNLIYALENIDTKYVCFMLEDFFLRSPVDQSKFLYCLRFAEINNSDMIRLISKPTLYTKDLKRDLLISKLSTKGPYRVSCQASLWKRDTLLSLLVAGESAWEFEINGTERSRNINLNFYSTKKSVLTYYHHVVERGIWFPWDAWYFKRMNISCDFSSRKVMSWPHGIFWLIRKVIFKLKMHSKIFFQRILNEL